VACPGFAYVAQSTAPAVQRLLDAGAVLVGKTNLDQFATGLVGVRSPYGVPRNVFDPSRVPGGSSSGSAVAVAAAIVPFALGTDTAGSGRVPAAFGNIVGLKPTVGSLSKRNVVPACNSIDTISVFGRSLDEVLAVQRVAARYDEADPYSRAAPFAHLRRGARPAAPRVAMADCGALCVAPVADAYARAAALLDARTDDIAPFLEMARLLYDGPWVAERTAALRAFIERRPGDLHPITRAIIEGGFARCTVDAFGAFRASPRSAASRNGCSPNTTPCCCRPCRSALRSPSWTPIRSHQTAGSAPSPISSICATSRPLPSRPAWVLTACRSASR
jgi:allophanate hydrolase